MAAERGKIALLEAASRLNCVGQWRLFPDVRQSGNSSSLGGSAGSNSRAGTGVCSATIFPASIPRMYEERDTWQRDKATLPPRSFRRFSTPAVSQILVGREHWHIWGWLVPDALQSRTARGSDADVGVDVFPERGEVSVGGARMWATAARGAGIATPNRSAPCAGPPARDLSPLPSLKQRPRCEICAAFSFKVFVTLAVTLPPVVDRPGRMTRLRRFRTSLALCWRRHEVPVCACVRCSGRPPSPGSGRRSCPTFPSAPSRLESDCRVHGCIRDRVCLWPCR